MTVFAAAGAGTIIHLLQGLPRVNANTFTNLSAGTIVYDVHGKVIGTFSKDGDRQPIESLDQVSKNLTNAFIAAEDKTFYKNMGVNPIAMARALVQNITGGKIQSGASTITQQTVKLAVFPEQQRTMKRKIQEIALSLEVNRMLSKDEIMTDYMNWVYMGKMGSRNVYGVKRASEILFQKEPNQLSLAEATYLAAIPNNPAYFSPYHYPNHVKERQRYILDQMLANHMISNRAYTLALNTRVQALIHTAPASTAKYPYVMGEIENQVTHALVTAGLYRTVDDADQALTTVGYRIHTTIDRNVQDRMDAVLNQEARFRHTSRKAPGMAKPDLYQAGMTVVDNATGGILALDGGRPSHYGEDQINHADLPRQPGSTIKPLIVYGPAIEKRVLTAGSMLDDSPAVFDEGKPWQYEPKDDSARWHGPVTVRQALVQSLNLPAIRALYMLHPEIGTSYLPKLGIHPGDKTATGHPTLVVEDTHHLGVGIGGLTYGLTLKQMTSAFTVFPNQGVWREPVLVRRITDETGTLVYVSRPVAHRAFSPQTAYIVSSMLRDVVTQPNGTGRWVGYRFPHQWIAGKTGTTDDQQNGWFIGYTPKYTLGIWMGYNHNQSISNAYYGLKFTLWNDVMASLNNASPTENQSAPTVPPGIVARKVCNVTGRLATPACDERHKSYVEWYLRGTEPTDFCALHGDRGNLPTPVASNEALTIQHFSALQGPGGVALSWDPVPGVAFYSVWKSTKPDGPFERVASPTPFTVMVDTETPTPGQVVYYQVHAERGDGTAIPSNTIKCLPITESTNGDNGSTVAPLTHSTR